MPVLQSLRDRGGAHVLRSTPNYQSASAWTSLVTGVNPGRHGILHFTNPTRGEYGYAQIDARANRARTIWQMLSEAGRTVAALNVPVSFPVEQVNGVMVAGWLCPSPSESGFTHPTELADEIRDRFGEYPIHPDVRRHARAGRYDRVVEIATGGIRTKLEVARWLLEREGPDLLWAVVTETDSLQHWCLDLIDESHPEHDPEAAERWREEILSVYSALDEELGRLVEQAGSSADVLVFSDHGQAPNSGAQVLLRPWLVDAGYLGPERRPLLRRAADGVLRRGFELVRSRAPNRLKVWLRSRFGGLQSRAQAGARGIEEDWERTRAWTDAGHIFINLRGRQPRGTVEPGEEHRALIDELSAGLRDLRDARTGEPVVADVTHGEDVFRGPYADIMPDLLVHWRNDLRVRRLVSTVGGTERIVERHHPPSMPPGAHHPDGTLIAAGPSFRRLADGERQSVYDIAPTLLHLLGLPIPETLDGTVMVDLLTEDAAKGVRRVATKEDVAASRADADGNARGSDTVARRLRSLGYIE